jgi:hypothetical protein
VWRYDDSYNADRIVSPFEVGLRRGGCEKAIVDLGDLRVAIKGMVEDLSGAVIGAECTPFTVDEALERQFGLQPVDPLKGAALPEPGKKGAFMLETNDQGEIHRYADQRLRGAVLRLMTRLARGELLMGQSNSSLKDELLDKKKIESVKTRIFENIPLDQYIVNRMMYGKFVPRLVVALRRYGVCIGINASSKDWNWVFSRTNVATKGGLLAAMDYSRMDKNFVFAVHVAVLEVLCTLGVISMRDKEEGTQYARDYLRGVKSKCEHTRFEVFDAIMKGVLWMELMSQRKIDGAYVFSYAGNSSGSFWTTLVNCLVSIMYIWLCYRRENPTMPWRVFVDLVLAVACFYGDDTRKIFRYPGMTPEVLYGHMKTLAQEVTSSQGQKGDLVVDTQGGKTFLKRGFRVVGDRVYCPLEVTSIVKSLLAFQPSGNREQDVRRHLACLTTAWEEAFFHEDLVRDQIRALVLRCAKFVQGGDSLRLVSDAELSARWEAGTFRVWDLM